MSGCSLKHSIHSIFGAWLIQRHFELGNDEMTLEEDSKTAPTKIFNSIHAQVEYIWMKVSALTNSRENQSPLCQRLSPMSINKSWSNIS